MANNHSPVLGFNVHQPSEPLAIVSQKIDSIESIFFNRVKGIENWILEDIMKGYENDRKAFNRFKLKRISPTKHKKKKSARNRHELKGNQSRESQNGFDKRESLENETI